MPARGRQAPEPEPEQEEPPYYVATAPLPYGGPGSLPVIAHQAGDHVSPADVAAYRWGDLVEVPEQFAGRLAPPPKPEPDEKE